MKALIIFKKIKNFYSHELLVLGLILLLVYFLRILPYLLGYSIPFAEEGMRDFQQVQFFIDHQGPNLINSYFNYGNFFILHLIVYLISLVGFSPLKIFLFVPQVFVSFGLIFYYLFLRRYFSIVNSLWAIFLISVFIPNIYWSSQPMRETIGLFLFPLIIYLFDLYFNSQTNRANWTVSVALIFALPLMVFSHYGSTIMIFGWLVVYPIFFSQQLKNFFKSWLWSGYLLALAVTFWHYSFPRGLEIGQQVLAEFTSPPFLVILAFTVLIVWLKVKYDFTLKIFKNFWFKIFTIFLILTFFIIVAFKFAPISYPLQTWLSFLIYTILLFYGFFYFDSKELDNFTWLNIFYVLIWLIGGLFWFNGGNLKTMPFDPFRTLEFAIYPLSIIAAFGLIKVGQSWSVGPKLLGFLLILLATTAFPSIYIYKTNFAGTIFYDIRSDIRYISPAVRQLIDWANQNGYSVSSPIPEVKTYQEIFYPPQQHLVLLFTNRDKLIKNNYDYIKDPVVGVDDLVFFQTLSKLENKKPAFENNEGAVYLIDDDAEFVSQEFPKRVVAGQSMKIKIIMRNSGTSIWVPSLFYRLRLINQETIKGWDFANIRVIKSVSPNNLAIFEREVKAPDTPGRYFFEWQMNIKQGNYFGQTVPKVSVDVLPEKNN